VEVVSFYVDADVSGVTRPRDRSQYRAMLEAARALGIRLLLFYDLSRLSRSLEEDLDFRFATQEFPGELA
jgi:DNA invertase Pin-like site-specific DNA recombinase